VSISTNIRPKYHLIADHLKMRIQDGRIQPGDGLPSQNALVEEYGVALGTVRQAINMLVAEGWIRTEKGRGIFASKPSAPIQSSENLRSKTFGFAVLGAEELFRNDPACLIELNAVASVLRGAGKRLSYAIFPEQGIGASQPFGEFLDEVSAVILHQYVSAEAVECIRRHDVRAVILGYPLFKLDATFSGFNVVSIDLESCGYLAGQALAIYGHKRIGLVHTLNTFADEVTKRGFERACRDHSIEHYEIFMESDRDKEVDLARRLAKDPTMTGLVVVGSMHAGRFVQDLAAMGVCVPADKSVIAIGNMPRELCGGIDLARLTEGEMRMGEEAAMLLLSPSDTATIRMLPPRIEWGKTLAHPPK
jgi:GntR family transcriptional regulator of arabinose operon